MSEKILIITSKTRAIGYTDLLNFYQLSILEQNPPAQTGELLPGLANFNLPEQELVIIEYQTMSGTLELAQKIREDFPAMALLLIDDFGNRINHQDFMEIGGHGQTRFLPWRQSNPEELLTAVQALLHPAYPTAKKDIAIILPVFNEEKRFHNVFNFVQKLKKLLEESFLDINVYFVNDGSKDFTQSLLEGVVEKYYNETDYIFDQSFFKTSELEYNTRKAGTYINGIQTIQAEYLLFVDADDSFRIEDIAAMINIIKEGYYDLIVATKDLSAENRPLIRRLLSFFKRLLTKPLLPKGVYDSQTGLKILSSTSARYILPHLHENTGLAIDLEMLFLARKLKFRVLQIPVFCIDREGSHVDIVRDSLKFIKSIFGIVWRNLKI